MPFEDAVLDAVRRYASVFLRLALGATFLTAVGRSVPPVGTRRRCEPSRGGISSASPRTPLN
jgi:hypothetical protein